MMIISDDGIIIRIAVENVGTYSRNTQGVKLINLNEGSKVSAVAVVKEEDLNNDEELNDINDVEMQKQS